MDTRIISIDEVARWVRDEVGFDVENVTTIGGERLWVCDEAVAVINGDYGIVAVATIAPEGEGHSGQPTIVGLYTMPMFRRTGFGRAAFKAAIDRCRERGFPQVRVDVTSRHVMRIIKVLTPEDRAYLIVNDYGDLMTGFIR